MDHKYQNEIDDFTNNFMSYRNENIILYGIGRYTATLVEGVKGFHFAGLMDKSSENIGKTFFGLPVIDPVMAEKMGDLVIINTSETYWDVIYDRISDLKIPVYYKNGKRAKKRLKCGSENPFYDLSVESLYNRIDQAQVISFDFFDTLFMRAVCDPEDIFRLLEVEIQEEWQCANNFIEIRNEAKKRLKKQYSLDDLYKEIEKLSALPGPVIQSIKKKELQVEKKLLVPRPESVEVMQYALRKKKAVYVVSDMYLPLHFFAEMLNSCQIKLPEENILVSCVLDCSKKDGSLWDYYNKRIIKERAALHIGDHQKADIEIPRKYGINTYLAPSSGEILSASSMHGLLTNVCSNYAAAIAGCVRQKLFRNVYTLLRRDGMTVLKSNQEMGYAVFGPVILTFLLWLLQESKRDQIKKLVFMSRDGYFLQEDFTFLCELLGEKRENCYLGISRQLVMSASVTSGEELLDYMSMPYTGSMEELFEDRLGIKGVTRAEGRSLEEQIKIHFTEIQNHIREIRKNYLCYLERMNLDNDCAVVDLGYYGNNQKYLNQLTGKRIRGYYFNADLSRQERDEQKPEMKACFQQERDKTGKNSQILKRMIYIESVLTAPYGMVRAVDAEGNFVCAEKKNNQNYFDDKREINEGIKEFIYDYVRLFGTLGLNPDRQFVDWYYGFCFSGTMEFSDDIKRSFYNDNGMMNRIESMLFY